jgi:hypothetical protein
MKRDLDLVRAILLDVEARGTPLDLIDPEVDGSTRCRSLIM